MAQAQAPSQSQFQPPLFEVQQWTQSFPTGTAIAAAAATTTTPAENEKYVISTDPSLISLSAVTDAFSQEYVYWAKPLPAPVMKDMIDRSLCFGVYRCNNNNDADNNNQNGAVDAANDAAGFTQIGFARLITDNITFAYLTDVYILPEYQGTGLGSWLLECINAWVDGQGEYFRRFMLVTVGERAKGYYQRVIGAQTQGREGDVFVMEKKGKAALV